MQRAVGGEKEDVNRKRKNDLEQEHRKQNEISPQGVGQPSSQDAVAAKKLARPRCC
jgi:hypothetical protein